jgi:hypothetical protein
MTAQQGEKTPRRWLSSWSAPLIAITGMLALVGCGGGLPLLHPARVLDAGDVRAFAGFSGNVSTGDLAGALRSAGSEAISGPGQSAPPSDETYAKGALVEASVAPGLAPLVGARVGIGEQLEGGIAYTGRAIRIDLRRSFDVSTHWSVSLGAGGLAALCGHEEGGALAGVDLSQLHGWGADIPLVVGYASDADLYTLWLGIRGGGEEVSIGEVRSEPKAVSLGTPPVSLSATRWWGGGLFGLAVGFRHVHVAMEIDVAYASIAGDFGGTHAQVGGLTIAPGTAAWWRF